MNINTSGNFSEDEIRVFFPFGLLLKRRLKKFLLFFFEQLYQENFPLQIVTNLVSCVTTAFISFHKYQALFRLELFVSLD